MNDCNHILPDDLSDEAAAQMLELLHEISRIFEDRYAAQINRYYRSYDPRQPDLWD
jgi:hypothetical protein